jgi:hypothetical protein
MHCIINCSYSFTWILFTYCIDTAWRCLQPATFCCILMLHFNSCVDGWSVVTVPLLKFQLLCVVMLTRELDPGRRTRSAVGYALCSSAEMCWSCVHMSPKGAPSSTNIAVRMFSAVRKLSTVKDFDILVLQQRVSWWLHTVTYCFTKFVARSKLTNIKSTLYNTVFLS